MRIAPLRPDHRARLADLLMATRAFSADEVQVALSLLDVAADGTDDSYEFLGAFDETDRLLGYACFGPTPATEGTYDLYWLAVDPAAQGRGCGRALTAEVERLLAARGGRMLMAETSGRPDYAATRSFYQATGYTEAARVQDFYAPADDRIMLYRRLTAPERGVMTR
jgi:ribosomal protein S18 acetylase RimI-like enzyme